MRERSVEVSQRFASAADRARWLTSHKPVPTPISIAQGDALDIGSRHFPPPPFGAIAGDVAPAEGPPTGAGPIDVGDGLFTYGQLLALPTDRPSRTVADRPGLDGAAPSIRADGVYSGANGGSDPCLPRASVRVWPATTLDHAGRLVHVYRIGPGRFHRRVWCAGRYELGIQTFPSPLPPRYTTPPYTSPTGTSIYFEVR